MLYIRYIHKNVKAIRIRKESFRKIRFYLFINCVILLIFALFLTRTLQIVAV